MARGIVHVDAARCFGRWLVHQPGVGSAIAVRVVEQARRREQVGVGLLRAWLAESGLADADATGTAELLLAVPRRAARATRSAAGAIRRLLTKHGMQPAQLLAAQVRDLVEDEGRVVLRLGTRTTPLDDEDLGLLRQIIAAGRDGRPEPNDLLIVRPATGDGRPCAEFEDTIETMVGQSPYDVFAMRDFASACGVSPHNQNLQRTVRDMIDRAKLVASGVAQNRRYRAGSLADATCLTSVP